MASLASRRVAVFTLVVAAAGQAGEAVAGQVVGPVAAQMGQAAAAQVGEAVGGQVGEAAAEQAGEYELKGELLTRFADFVDFPESAFSDASSPIVIGLFGEDPFGSALDRAVRDRRVEGRTLMIQVFHTVHELETFGPPQILFVPSSARALYGAVFAVVAGRPVLTVGEEPSFARDRGLVNLTIVERRAHLEIAKGRAEAAGLHINARLLQMSRILDGNGPP